MSGYVPSGHWTQNRRLQFIEEVQYGVTPASSPAFTSAGEIESISETTEVAMKRYRTVGTEDLYQFLSSGQLYSFEVSYQPISSALIKYGTQAQGGGVGTIDKSLSFLYSEDVNDVKNYVFCKGARCDQVTFDIMSEAVKVSQNFICLEITTLAISHGLTTPTFAPS